MNTLDKTTRVHWRWVAYIGARERRNAYVNDVREGRKIYNVETSMQLLKERCATYRAWVVEQQGN